MLFTNSGKNGYYPKTPKPQNPKTPEFLICKFMFRFEIKTEQLKYSRMAQIFTGEVL